MVSPYPGEMVFRPPLESQSFLLMVTHSCSHNKCSFCSMYRDIPFGIESEENIEEQLKMFTQFSSRFQRVFLVNGDAFVLSADQLSRIADLVHIYLPKATTITMFASINNIRTKTDEDLLRLREAGINELNIGLESGLEYALHWMNKGYTAQEAEKQLLRLRHAGIDFSANIIFGSAGRGRWKENAEATAGLLNKVKPYMIFTTSLFAYPNCPLYDDMRSGRFQECTLGDLLDEEGYFLSLLDLQKCDYIAMHPSNVTPKRGMLPESKESLLSEVWKTRSKYSEQLDLLPVRGEEGTFIL